MRNAVYVLVAMLATACGTPAHAQLIIAHRGASHDAPENTLAAFNLAWEQGADGIEADFYLTGDGKIICFHDKDTERVAGVKHVIGETPFDALRKLDVGAWKNERFRGERPPTIEEIIATIPKGKKFFIELKVGPEIVEPLAEAIKASPLEPEQIVIISFNADTVAECERVMPHLMTHWLVRYEEKNGQWTPAVDSVLATLQQSDADALGTQAETKVVTKTFLKTLCDGGECDFGVWTVDDPKVARLYRDLGAWSITTNRPGWLREQLNGKAETATTVK